MHSTLVSTAELAAHLSNWTVIDCRFDLRDEAAGRRAYLTSHIAGAAYASLSDDLSAPLTGTNGRHPLPTVEAMEAVFSRLGIGRQSQVVAYDADSGMYASRLWWMLRYLGHDAVAVLDGGWAAWLRESRPVSAGEERHPPQSFTAAVRPQMRVDVESLAALVAAGATRLVDARAPERYEGRTEPIDRVAGHIPGAINHFFKQNMTPDDTMRPAEELRADLAAVVGNRSPEDVVMYCGSGVTACQNLLALEHAGIRGVRLYPGSWSEWSAEPGRPVETGPREPR